MFTDKLVLRWLEVLDVWSLDSATPATLTYPAHASGLSKVEFFPWGAKGPQGSGGTKKRGGKSYKEVIKKG
jgi:hypothetical protein